VQRAEPRENHRISAYVDIHAHVLPGLDDGPPDLEESLAMASAAAESGIATIAATPHLHPGFPDVRIDEVAARCDRLREVLDRERIPLELVPAAEVALPWALEASDQHLVLASYGQRGTDLLIETPFARVVGFDRFLYSLQAKGFRITLGHPERNGSFQQDPTPLRALVEGGVLLQVNAESLLGPAGRGAKRLARNLLTEGLAHAIASDAHRARSWRPVTNLREGVSAAAELVGQERARWLSEAVPAAIVAGAELPPPPPTASGPARRWRLFGLR
jgi:protein-tyrosine phosphatase